MLARVARTTVARASALSMAPAGTRSISFALTDDQKAMQKLARDFAVNEVMPKAAELDRTMEYPEELFKKVSAAASRVVAATETRRAAPLPPRTSCANAAGAPADRCASPLVRVGIKGRACAGAGASRGAGAHVFGTPANPPPPGT